MKNRKKIILAFIILIISFAGFYFYSQQKKILHLGIFAGSNWDVPQGETYAIIDEAIKDFLAENPGVQVKYVSGIKREDYSEWLAEKFIEGDEPDIFFLLSDDFNLYASMGALTDLTNLIEDDEEISEKNYYQAAFNFGKFEKKSFAMPFASTLTFMFVNKTLLSKEGIEIPKNNWTWKDFLEICRKVTKDTDGDGKLDQFGFYGYSWQQAAISNGVILFREDGKTSYFANSQMEETVKFLIELHDVHQGYEVTEKDFDIGHVAFRPFTFAEYQTYKPYPWRIKKYTAFEWDCVKMPAGPSGGNISELNTLLIAMSSRTKNKNLAWKFMKKFCCDKKIQRMLIKKSQALPVRRDVIISSEAQDIFSWAPEDKSAITPADISETMDNSIMPFKFRNYSTAMLFADAEILKIINGNVPLNNSLNKLQKKINSFLQN